MKFNRLVITTLLIIPAAISGCSEKPQSFEKSKEHIWGSVSYGCNYQRIHFDNNYLTMYQSDELKEKLAGYGTAEKTDNSASSRIISIDYDSHNSFIISDDRAYSWKFSINEDATNLHLIEFGNQGRRIPINPNNGIVETDFQICKT